MDEMAMAEFAMIVLAGVSLGGFLSLGWVARGLYDELLGLRGWSDQAFGGEAGND